MPIEIEKADDGYLARVDAARTAPRWETVRPLGRDELIAALREQGCHQTRHRRRVLRGAWTPEWLCVKPDPGLAAHRPALLATSRSRPAGSCASIERAERGRLLRAAMSVRPLRALERAPGRVRAFAWSFLGAALARTSLPFGVVNAPGQRYHPAIIAQAAATLCEMFPERLWIALGSGEASNEHITGERLAAQGDPQRAAARVRGHHAGAVRGRGGLARRARGRRPR